MKLTLGFDDVLSEKLYSLLLSELMPYSPLLVTRRDNQVVVEADGDVVACMCIVAICEKYRYAKGVGDEKLDGNV